MWEFCIHSLVREYGWQFFWRIAVPHPVRTARALFGAHALDISGSMTALSSEGREGRCGGERAIVGLGFCLKPMDPPCPAGRPNHDCAYFENGRHAKAPDVPLACQPCAIREIGTMALRAGAACYIMTSAKEILLDVFTPALDEGRFSSGLFVLCRYSLRPFAVGLLAAGIRGWLFSFEKGDCRDYKTWLQADRGIKQEQTALSESSRRAIKEFLRPIAREPAPATRFERRGNVFYPLMEAGESNARKDAVPPRGRAGNEMR